MDLEEYANKNTALPVQALLHLFALAIATIPLALALLPLALLDGKLGVALAMALGPTTFALTFVGLAGALSRPFQRAIVPTKAPRRLKHFVYGPRRLYGLCWNFVYYSGPIYQAFLGLPLLRRYLLRLFGYRGSVDVAIAPDAWVRDLPVLSLEAGAYLANKCTVGTNICLADGWIIVDAISLGRNAMIGHGAVIGPGARLGEGSEVGVNGMFGIRSKAGSKVSVGIRSTISHQVELGDGASVANAALIGLKSKIGPGVKIPFGAVIPERAIVTTQAEADGYSNAETHVLRADRESLVGELARRIEGPAPMLGANR